MPHSSIPEWATHLMTLLGGGFGAKALDWLIARRKKRLESDIALQQAIDRRVKLILDDDEKTIGRLTAEVGKAEERISAMEEYIGLLVEALRTANISIPRRPEIIKPK